MAEDLEGPLLMELFSHYEQSIKLFIIGQETNGWCCDYNDHDSLLGTYMRFKRGEKLCSSPFRDITRKVEALIGIARDSCVWSNINRYDHNGGEPKGEILNEIRSLDYLVAEEVSAIQPDVCSLRTGNMIIAFRGFTWEFKWKRSMDCHSITLCGYATNHYQDIPSEHLTPKQYACKNGKMLLFMQ
jgi:hypothetical protein